ncbi:MULTISPECIES: polysaccharide pyruvyl transferase family protein [Acinetobacter]|uniref:polysaccharide pyruvyl transferase family protein n=1 Tax=Acinetobacter TaxID=469 RepID=UPI00144494C5|nr:MULTISPECIES: polysaccharide pyruvyl transferase family protein [Acinetobacter]
MSIFSRKKKPLGFEHQACLTINKGGLIHTQPPLFAYWWDVNQNFGDWIGPWLIALMTDRVVVNTREQQVSTSLFSVGSIFGHITADQGTVDVWGSGIIAPLEQKKILKRLKASSTPQIHAVRGKLTQQEIQNKLNWKVPNIYGDPALLISDYYKHRSLNIKIAICPHHIHYQKVKDKLSGYEDVHVVDVMQSPEKVIDEIASADVCLSSSLHGLIIAQAYEVPWRWLRFSEDQLVGDKFKFYDFFSIFENGEKILPIDVSYEHLDQAFIRLQANTGSLGKMNISLNDLKNSFPL